MPFKKFTRFRYSGGDCLICTRHQDMIICKRCMRKYGLRHALIVCRLLRPDIPATKNISWNKVRYDGVIPR